MRRARRRKKTVRNWFVNLSKKKKIAIISGAVLFVLVIGAWTFIMSKFNKMETEDFRSEEIIINDFGGEDIATGYTNFALFGSDSRSDNVTKNLNTDTIIVVSLNNETKEVKMVSVYRDTLLDMTNGNIQKCNSAYARGGAKQAINMLNMNLDLDIRKYVTVNFSAVVDVVDMLGGITVDVSEKEVKATNEYIKETAKVVGGKPDYLEEAGVQTLNGVQATTYARIRKGVGDDYARTERQRLVITKIVEKAMKSDLVTINKIIDAVLPKISTNFSEREIISYASKFLTYSMGENTGFPFEKSSGTVIRRGSCVFATPLDKNVQMLHEFLFEKTDYNPSPKVEEISEEIDELVGRNKSGSSSNHSNADSSKGSSNNDSTNKEETFIELPNNSQTKPEITPEEPEKTPEEPEETPEEPEETPEESEETPEEPEETPKEPEESEETPKEPEEPEETPEEPEETPEESEEAPTETEETPTETETP